MASTTHSPSCHNHDSWSWFGSAIQGLIPNPLGAVTCPIAATVPPMTPTHSSHRHRGLGIRPAGKSSSANGRHKVIAHGQAKKYTVMTVRRLSTDQPLLNARLNAGDTAADIA